MSSPRRHRLLSFNSEPGHHGGAKSTGNALPMLTKPKTGRNIIVAALGEFVGTFLFLFFSFAGTQIANTGPPSDVAVPPPNTPNLIFIALAFGMSLMANVWAFYRVTGGLFNPVVGFTSPPSLDSRLLVATLTHRAPRLPSPSFSSAVFPVSAPVS